MGEVKVFAIVFVGVFLIFGIGFILGFLVAYKNEDQEEACTPLQVYCFQCEIEMPTKVKHGILHCSNCGLKH